MTFHIGNVKYQYQFSIKSISFITNDIKILFVLHCVTNCEKKVTVSKIKYDKIKRIKMIKTIFFF
jgi:hypothetical protein